MRWKSSITSPKKGQKKKVKPVKIEILDIIDDWYGVEPSAVIRQITRASDKESIELIVNSPGGEVFGSIGIMEALRNHKGTVTSYVMGLAASAASFIVIGGSDKIKIGKFSQFMIHKAMTLTWGNADDLHKTADHLDSIDNILARIYSERAAEGTDIVKMIAEETWIGAEEAVKIGFADEILEKSGEVKDEEVAKITAWKKILQNRKENQNLATQFIKKYDINESSGDKQEEQEAEALLRLMALGVSTNAKHSLRRD